MSEIIDATADRDDVVQQAARALQGGEIVVVPTDTVYGVAADAFQSHATARIFELKRRPRTFPLPVLIRSPKQLLGLCTVVPEEADALMAAYWPGPLTIVVAADPNLMWDLGDSQGTVSVRMPLDDVTLDIIRAVGPLAVTSANLAGQPAASTAREAQRQLGDGVAVYVDDGPRRGADPSTIVDLTRHEPHVLRQGALDPDEVLAVARGELDPMDVGRDDAPASADADADAVADRDNTHEADDL